jgi:ubiquinone/menaquinone biosynthesis C-methylase UbiE
VVDHGFADAELAALYDIRYPADQRTDFRFYWDSIMSAGSVLDVGCGTGSMLNAARDAGHTGRLCGLDPADGMLAVARRRTDIEWVRGDLGSVSWDREFDLIVMTGHAFQVLLTDEELRSALATIRAALTPEGRFAFETRNPAARGWEAWTSDRTTGVTDRHGVGVRMYSQVTSVDGDLVSFTATYESAAWPQPRHSESTLRFLDVTPLDTLLTEAGLTVRERYGDWSGGPLTATSPEIITFAEHHSAE